MQNLLPNIGSRVMVNERVFHLNVYVIHFPNCNRVLTEKTSIMSTIVLVALHQKSNMLKSKLQWNLTYDALLKSLSFNVAQRECKQVAKDCFMFVNTCNIKRNHTPNHSYIILRCVAKEIIHMAWLGFPVHLLLKLFTLERKPFSATWTREQHLDLQAR